MLIVILTVVITMVIIIPMIIVSVMIIIVIVIIELKAYILIFLSPHDCQAQVLLFLHWDIKQ